MKNSNRNSIKEMFLPLTIISKEVNFNDQRQYLKVEEQYLLSKSLLDQITEEEVHRADLNAHNFKIYSKKSDQEISLDARWLLQYLKNGRELSGYIFEIRRIFANKQLKRRLYFLNSIYVNDKPCNTINALDLLLNQLEIIRKLERISEIWDAPFPMFNSYMEKYRFIKQINAWVKEMLQEYKRTDTGIDHILSKKVM